MKLWTALASRVVAIPIGFLAGATLALMWTGFQRPGHHSPCGAKARSAAAYHAGEPAREVRTLTVAAGQQLVVDVDGELERVVAHPARGERSSSVVQFGTAPDGRQLVVQGTHPGEASLIADLADGERLIYRVRVLEADYQPYKSPCQKRRIELR